MTRKDIKRYGRGFKLEIVHQGEETGKPVTERAGELGFSVPPLYLWRGEVYKEGADEAFPGKGQRSGTRRNRAVKK